MRLTADCTAPKGLENLAQGFNPGYGTLTQRALKGHKNGCVASSSAIQNAVRTRSGATFRAHPMATPYPGLKPWAILLGPFGADEDGLPRRSLRRRDDEYDDDKSGSTPDL